MENFKKVHVLQKTVHCNTYEKQFFSCAQLLCTYEEKIEIQLQQCIINIPKFQKK